MRPFVLLAISIPILLAACPAPDDSGGSPDAGLSSGDARGSQDGSTCHPTTCAAHGAQCGTLSDGCGHDLDCGQCDWTDSCTNNVCVCSPYCGSRDCGDDGCGGSCGMCGTNETCSSSGHCTYSGGGTTPPAEWHCNPAYWDAGDGCDCNCGALDPDCGEAGQQLEGCTGLTSPTCDSQGLCTGGGACNAVPTGPYLTLYLVNGTPPTMYGGTIQSGRWEANDVKDYGSVSGYVTGGGNGSAIEI